MVDLYQNMRFEDVDGVRIAVVDAGPEDGIPVLLIHGFPDTSKIWRYQIPVLADAGYRVLAPDLRGYGQSDAPEKVSDYHISKVVTDMLTVLGRAGAEKAHIVGHDWGAGITWAIGSYAPEVVRSLTVLAVGHPGSFASAGWAQKKKSWYMLYFRMRGLAEWSIRRKDWKALRWGTRHREIENWIPDLERPGRLTSALNIYRANVRLRGFFIRGSSPTTLDLPVMGVWSSKEVVLTEVQMTGSKEYVSGEWRYERIEGVGHWTPVSAPDEVNALLLDWLGTR